MQITAHVVHLRKSMKTILHILIALIMCFTASGTVITSLGRANAIPLESITKPMDFNFTGTVLKVNRKLIVFANNSGGTILFHATAEHGLQQWDRILTKGEMTIADTDKTRRFLSKEIKILSNGARPPVIDVSAKEINDGNCNFKLVRIRGVVSSCIPDEFSPSFFWTLLKTREGNCYVTISRETISALLHDAYCST